MIWLAGVAAWKKHHAVWQCLTPPPPSPSNSNWMSSAWFEASCVSPALVQLTGSDSHDNPPPQTESHRYTELVNTRPPGAQTAECTDIQLQLPGTFTVHEWEDWRPCTGGWAPHRQALGSKLTGYFLCYFRHWKFSLSPRQMVEEEKTRRGKNTSSLFILLGEEEQKIFACRGNIFFMRRTLSSCLKRFRVYWFVGNVFFLERNISRDRNTSGSTGLITNHPFYGN